jgi:hypothetical protein
MFYGMLAGACLGFMRSGWVGEELGEEYIKTPGGCPASLLTISLFAYVK